MAPKPKLTIAQIGELRAYAKANPEMSQEALAEKFGVGRTTITGYLKGAEAADAPLPMPGLLMLSTAQILMSSLNPRKSFDNEALAELVNSIKTNGLLQNLVVRPAKNGFYELVAGERRFRAIRVLEESQQWNEKIPCRLITGDDGQHLALALLENLQRVDVPPLEEAEAFVQLQAIDPVLWSTANIAAQIGKSARYVQQRLSLAGKLCEAAKKALADKQINIEGARLLTTVAQDIQQDILDRAEGKITAEDIAGELRGTLMEVEVAFFDVAAAGLETIELDGDEFFADSKKARELQLQAVAAKAKELKKKWAFVNVVKPPQWFYPGEYISGKTKAQGGGAVIVVRRHDYAVDIIEGVMKKPAPPPRVQAPQPAKGPKDYPNAALFTDAADDANGVRETAPKPDPVLAEQPEFTLERILTFARPPGMTERENALLSALIELIDEAMPENWQDGDDGGVGGLAMEQGETDAWRQAIETVCETKKIPVPSWVEAKETA